MNDHLHALLEESYSRYHLASFIETDPVQVPHLFSKKEDIEIAGFLTATIAWGQRKTIISNARKLMTLLENAPHDFLLHAEEADWKRFNRFVHRTFQPADLHYFLDALKRIYSTEGGLEKVFTRGYQKNQVKGALCEFRETFFQWNPLARTGKHVSNPAAGSAAKRLNLFLMWMVRADDLGIHFGLWKSISPSELLMPLDVHVGRVARQLELLTRKASDWKAANELTQRLKEFDPEDPTKYDFSLFGLGLDKSFSHGQ